MATAVLVLALGACGGGATTEAVDTVRGGVASDPVIAQVEPTATQVIDPLLAAAPDTATLDDVVDTVAGFDPFAQPTVVAAKSSKATKATKAPTPLVVMGRLRIPRLNLDTTVYEGNTLDVIDHGPGHYPGAPLPGRQGNVVIAGHRVTHSKPFRYLDTLKPGDQAIFDLPDGGQHIYEFTHHEIVTPDRVEITAQTDDFRATMFGCHPPGSAKYRIVAYWKLVSPPVLPPPPPPPPTTTTTSFLGNLLGN
jgi:LPXTG-site transpeptidase (sortase) family protein